MPTPREPAAVLKASTNSLVAVIVRTLNQLIALASLMFIVFGIQKFFPLPWAGLTQTSP
jgi:NADH:ubiquinone oxidoreductase subunit 3 (subunit A)